jgi:hypothetical protein
VDTILTMASLRKCRSPNSKGRGVALEDFVALMPGHHSTFIFTPCRQPWPGANVNARLPRRRLLDQFGQPVLDEKGKIRTISPTTWLIQNRSVEQMTWWPGRPMLIKDRLVVDGGWIERPGVTILNMYRQPRLKTGDADQAGPWCTHVREVYDEADAVHIIRWLAHRVQLPGEKINHALVLGGAQGIGKDTLLEPVKEAVGHSNFKDIAPTHLLGSFNSYARSVILRVNEARDLGEMNRFAFYDHSKVYTAAPPDVLRVNEKHLPEYYIVNCLGFLITTNHKTDGIYLPADDRRHYVAWSERTKEQFTPEYWNKLWDWYETGSGYGHVAAFLAEYDLDGFDPKAPPPKTAAFWDIVGAGSAPEDAELADVIEAMGNPDVLTLGQLIDCALEKKSEAADWLIERKNRRAIPHRMERCGYTSLRNPDAKSDGRWVFQHRKQVVYANAKLSVRDQIAAVRQMSKEGK